MFGNLSKYVDDPIEAMFVRLAADQHPDKIDLGIGVFRDKSGKVPVMRAAREAEQRLIERGLPKSYLSPLGNLDYCRRVERLVLGNKHPALAAARIASAQTPGAGSALRVAGELVKRLSPDTSVWFSEPIWTHQIEFFRNSGLNIRTYRYYDAERGALDAEGMLADLRAMRRDDVLLLHGCCHNPTGQDLDLDQWRSVAKVVQHTGAVPLIDVAYQGFGKGIDTDVEGVRMFAEQVPEMLLAVSSSKSFGIYRERAGLLSIIVPGEVKDVSSVRARLRDHARELYFMPPNHGAAIVNEILSTPELEALWRSELDAVREHIAGTRKALRVTIEQANPDFDASFIERQHGMFSCLPITNDEQQLIEQRFHIYMLPNARVNVAAMQSNQSATLAKAFAFVRARRTSDST